MFIRQLRYLVALARECHFARAAAACHVSQPALSAGLHKLECELGVRIIERTPQFRGFTPEGERVLIWPQRILADWQALVQDVSEESREGLQGTVRLGVVPAALPAVGVLVEEFCARYPATRVLIQQMSSRSIEQRLAEFELDAGLTYLDNEPLKDVIAQPLYREHYVFLTAVDGPWSGVRCVSWREVKEVPLCLLKDPGDEGDLGRYGLERRPQWRQRHPVLGVPPRAGGQGRLARERPNPHQPSRSKPPGLPKASTVVAGDREEGACVQSLTREGGTRTTTSRA